jgi:sialate O-acetylesterase
MAFRLATAKDGAEVIKAADRPTLRLFKVGRAYTNEPQKDVSGKWELSTPQSAEGFSAVAYFFGTELQKKVDVPIGLIEADWGGTRAEAWISRETFDALKLPYEPAWTHEWLHPATKPASTQPAKERPYEAPAVIYNGMIAPIAGYAMAGVVWYQGETNTAYPVEYRRVLTALINNWRSAWGRNDATFLIVQLPNFKGPTRDWVALRKSQAQVPREVPGVGLVVTIDIGNSTNIHPTDKLPVGQRLAALAGALVYELPGPFTGPSFRSMEIHGKEAVVHFRCTFGGLKAKGELSGFEVAGADGKFVAATGRIDGDAVVLRAEGVEKPKFARYGWANDPTCTLYNGAGFPAEPFSTQLDE